MERLYRFLLRHYTTIFKALLFIGSIAIVLYLFPREGKFRYEFQKGKPWMHDMLIAPYDFPIYKPEAQVTGERDSILREFKPFFNYDTMVMANQLEGFALAFDEEWANYLLTQYEIEEESELFRDTRRNRRIRQARDDLFEYGRNLLTFVYNKGIVQVGDVLERVNNKDSVIVVMKGKIGEEYDYSDVFTQKTAYEYVIQQVTRYAIEEDQPEIELFRDLDLNEFISPNLFYDDATSEMMKSELIGDISLTLGMVQSGERIISRGEVVSNDDFRVLESLRFEYEKRLGDTANQFVILMGQLIIISACFFVLLLFMLNFRRETFQDSLKTAFILFVVVLFVSIAALLMRYSTVSIYIIPLAIVPILIRTFYDARLALFIHLVTIIIIGFLAPNAFEFLFLTFLAGIVAIFSLTNTYRRGKLFLSSMLIILTYSMAYFGIGIIQEGNLNNIEWVNYLWFAANGGLVLLTIPLIYIFEKSFRFLSDATLFELSDTNQSLLRKLAEKAPGTFQHSLQVANLAEEAAIQLGGNPLLIRTGALYHDIGKMENPAFFIENQTTDVNPHDKLEFDESARMIIGHVNRGIEIAKKYNLPQQIIDFIRTHHGTTKVQYFYRSYLKKYPEEIVETSKFTYPGPRPFSKEMAILMIADSVEAASRSLKDKSIEVLEELVEKIIEYQKEENQFDDADITFRDINIIKKIFKEKLGNIYHARIEYPKAEKD